MFRNHLVFQVAAAAAVFITSNAQADVVVGEDFFYKQPSRTDTSYGDIRFGNANYGGGVNGPLGTWQNKWSGLGAGSIISDDVVAEPFASNPYTARFSGENVVNNDIQRTYSYSDTLADDQTIYFGGQFMTTTPTDQATFAEFGIFTAATTAGLENAPGTTAVASIGIENGTFFAHAGPRDIPANSSVALGDPGTVAGDTVMDNTFYTIIGKVEFNVAPSTVADYNLNGLIDAADYTIWRDNNGIDDGTATFEQGDGNGDGNVDGADYNLWSANYMAYTDRVTAYINPTGEEVSAGSTLVAEASISDGIFSPEAAAEMFLSGGYDLAGTGSAADSFIDDVVIGTTWDDVVSLLVPRLDAEVNTSTGAVTLINNTGGDVDLAYYEIVSASGSLETTYNSLEDQGTDGGEWLENNPTESRLTESNLLDTTTLAAGGGSLTLSGAFDVAGSQDLIIRWGLKEGNAGLLNLANLSYVGAGLAVPEPGALGLLVMAAIAGATGRRRGC